MAKNRKVVDDVTKISFKNTATANTSPGTPGLRTSLPDNGSSQIINSLAGFSSIFANLYTNSEKNKAAEEAIQAKNAALAEDFSKFNKFTYENSNEIYAATVGDIQGTKSITQMSSSLDEIINNISNKDFTPETIGEAYQMYDDARRKLIVDNFGPNGSNEFAQSDAYKMGFLPHINEISEKKRGELANKLQLKFNQNRQGMISQYTESLIEIADGGIFEGGNFDSDGNEIFSEEFNPGMDMNKFNLIMDKAIGLNMDEREAQLQVINQVGLKAAAEGRPELLRFMKQEFNGKKLTHDPDFNKLYDTYESQAITKYNTLEELKYKKSQRELKERREKVSSAITLQLMEDPFSPENHNLIVEGAKFGSLTNSTITAMYAFQQSLIAGEGNIHISQELVEKTYAQIAEGDSSLTVPKLAQMYSQSVKDGSGINRKILREMITDLRTQQNEDSDYNAYQVNLDVAKAIQISDTSLFGAVLPDGADPFDLMVRKKAIVANIIKEYKQSARAFRKKFPGLSLSSPEATEWFEEALQSAMANSELGPVLVPELSPGFLPGEKLRPGPDSDPKAFWDKHKRMNEIKNKSPKFKSMVDDIIMGK